MKTCSLCEAELPVSDFNKCSAAKDGKQSRCRSCQRSSFTSYREVNAERLRLAGRARYSENTEAEIERARRFRAEHPDSASASTRKWRLKNRDRFREYNSERRARVGNATMGPLRSGWRERLMAFYGGVCLHPECDAPADHIDHVVPLARGGEHSLHNFQPLCVHHNVTKGTKTVDYRNGKVFSE